MKKTVIAVGVIVAIGAVWTGTTWYTGQKVESELTRLTDEANQALQKSGASLKMDSFKRSFFSSEAEMSLHIPVEDGKTVIIPFIDQIEHGPFPVSRLKSLRLIPTMLVSHTTLGKNEVTQPVFDFVKGDNFFTASTSISYGGAFDTEISLLPVEFEKDGTTIKFSGLQVSGSASSFSTPVSAAGSMDLLSVQDSRNSFIMKDLRFDGVQSPVSMENYVAEQKGTIGQITYTSVSDKVTLALKNIALDGNITGDKEFYKGYILYSVDQTTIQDKDFGAGKLKIGFDNLDRAAIDDYNQAVQKQFFAADSAENILNQTEQQQRQLVEIGKQTFQRLLKKNPQFRIEPLSWKNSQGESLYNLDVRLQDAPIKEDENAALQAFAFIKELNSSLSISLPMSNELVTSFLTSQGMDPVQAEQEATTRINMMKGVISMVPGLVTEKEGSLLNNLQYSNGQVTLNDKKMFLEQFITEYLPFAGPSSQSEDNSDEDDGEAIQ
ncbi:MAG: YdgA family protein [Enterobacteriaceae bacterium]